MPQTVDSGTDAAVPDAGEDAAAIDAGPPVCASGDVCREGVCLPEDLGGTCAARCTHDADCGELDCLVLPDGEGFALGCGPGADPGYGPGNLCESDGDCRSLRCEARVCGRTCVDASECAPGMICTDVAVGFAPGTYGGCGFAARSEDLQVDEIPLGATGIASDGGGSEFAYVAVPEDAVSLTLVATQPDGATPLRIGFTSVTAPDTTLLLDAAALGRGDDTPLRDFSNPFVDAMLVPNSTVDRLTFLPGLYSWRPYSLPEIVDGPWPETDVEITALVKRAAGAIDAGTIDLSIWLVDIGVSAAAAPADARIQDALGEMEGVLDPAGITLGDVAYREPSDADAARLGVIDSTDGSDSELAEMFRLSVGDEGLRVNVFLVRSFASGINGIAGAITGAPGFHGTLHSGVAARAEAGTLTALQQGRLIAHEVSHFLGLFHVAENPDASPLYADDPIEDTPPDSQNLMFWSANMDDPNTILTDGQGYVMRRSALVR